MNYNQLADAEPDTSSQADLLCIPTIFGCTFKAAGNYDSSATTPACPRNGTCYNGCYWDISGCTDSTGMNYMLTATKDNPETPCNFPNFGCMAEGALNHVANASYDDGSCITLEFRTNPSDARNPCFHPKCVFVDGATNTTNCALNGYEPDGAAWYDAAGALVADGHAVVGALRVVWAMPAKELLPFIGTATADFGATDWCADLASLIQSKAGGASLLSTLSTGEAGSGEASDFTTWWSASDLGGLQSLFAPAFGSTISILMGACNYTRNTDPLGTCVFPVGGCRDPFALNFNPDATFQPAVDPCTYGQHGCLDSVARNYFTVYTVHKPEDCAYDVHGCTVLSATNYAANATIYDGSCVYESQVGCTDSRALNFYPSMKVDDGSCIASVEGCTNPNALNFDSTANRDSACAFPVLGCLDSGADNFDAAATSLCDASRPATVSCPCKYDGCDVPSALNYNPNVTHNDGSCTYAPKGCPDSLAENYDALAVVDAGLCDYKIVGCTDKDSFNFDSLANRNCYNCCNRRLPGCTDSRGANYKPSFNVDSGNCRYLGCTLSLKLDYDPSATAAARCAVEGCTDARYPNYRANAVYDDGSCKGGSGCTDSSFGNFDPIAIKGDPTTICISYYGCMDSTSDSFDPSATVSGFSPNLDNNQRVPGVTLPPDCRYPGCLDSTYDSFDGTKSFDVPELCFNRSPPQPSTPPTPPPSPPPPSPPPQQPPPQQPPSPSSPSSGTGSPSGGAGSGRRLEATAAVGRPLEADASTARVGTRRLLTGHEQRRLDPTVGCMDPIAVTYNASYSSHDGNQCTYAHGGCTDSTSVSYNIFATTFVASDCSYATPGCSVDTALNFDSAADFEDGTCRYALDGCTDSLADNFAADATDDDATCSYSPLGCTDADALNFNSLAAEDDSSCVTAEAGCADSLAENYAASANVQDDSCFYAINGCMAEVASNYDSLATVEAQGSCAYVRAGCTDSLYTDYVASANAMQAGGCIGSIPRGGCTVNAALTFDSLATFYVASACVYPVYGCMLAGYGNYDPAATADDGSCADSGVSGCTDSISLCYNPNATV